jgi:hypothetical protein
LIGSFLISKNEMINSRLNFSSKLMRRELLRELSNQAQVSRRRDHRELQFLILQLKVMGMFQQAILSKKLTLSSNFCHLERKIST